MASRIHAILKAAASMPWAIMPEKFEAICALLELRANGETVPADVVATHSARAAARRNVTAAVGGGAIAIIPIHGVIAPRMNMMTEMSGGMSAEQLVKRVQAAMENPQIAAVVFDVDSPGGAVAGVEEAAAQIFAYRGTKPMTAVVNHLMGSAAYYLGSAADEIVISPSGEAGSIGVFTMHTDQSGADAQNGIKRTLVRAGTYKAEDAPFFPLSDDAKAAMQEKIDAFYAQFVNAVAKHRGVSAEAVRTGYGQGRVLTAELAVKAGLADRIGTLDEVIAEYTGGKPSNSALALVPRADDGELPDDQDADDYAPATCPECGAELDADGHCPNCGYQAADDAQPIAARATLTTAAARAGAPTSDRSPRVRHIPIRVSASANSNSRNPTMSDKDPAAPAAGEMNREQEIREIAALAQSHAMQDKLPKWLETNASLTAVRSEVIAELKDRLAKGPTVKPRVQLTAAEEKRYSYRTAILSALDNSASFERDISEQLSKNLPLGYKPQGGFFMPTTLKGEGIPNGQVLAAGLDSATSTKGTELKFVQYGGFIDMLRNKSRVIQAGARMLGGLDGPVTFAKQTGAGTFSWTGENPGADVGESNLLLGTVSLQAKTGQSTTSFSRQLLRQAVEDVEQLVRSDLAAIHALGIDLAALAGTGASNQPTGVFNTSGVGVVSLGTNGAAPTYTSVINQIVQVAQANADAVGDGAFITTPGIKGTLQVTTKLANSIAQAVWDDQDRVAGKPGYDTNQVQSNLSKGTGVNLHAIYYGIWSQLVIGEWGAMEILVDPFRLKKQGMIEVTSFQMIDILVRYAVAFSLIKDAISTF